MKILSTKQLSELNLLTESMGANKSADILLKMGTVSIHDVTGKVHMVPAKSIIGVVNRGLYKIQSEYKFFYRFISKINIVYLPENNRYVNTMAVDDKGNMYICVSFIYNFCQMDPNNVFGILFHELMHVLLDHIARDKRIPGINLSDPETHNKLNIAADYEVNCSMVADSIVRSSFWQKMHGYWDPKYTGMPFEKIFDKINTDELEDESGSKLNDSINDMRKNIQDQLNKRRQELLDTLDDIEDGEDGEEDGDPQQGNSNGSNKQSGKSGKGSNKDDKSNDPNEQDESRLSKLQNIQQRLNDILDNIRTDLTKKEIDDLKRSVDTLKRGIEAIKSRLNESIDSSIDSLDDLLTSIERRYGKRDEMDDTTDNGSKSGKPGKPSKPGKGGDQDTKNTNSGDQNTKNTNSGDQNTKNTDNGSDDMSDDPFTGRDTDGSDDSESTDSLLDGIRDEIQKLSDEINKEIEKESSSMSNKPQNASDKAKDILDKLVDDLPDSEDSGDVKQQVDDLKKKIDQLSSGDINDDVVDDILDSIDNIFDESGTQIENSLIDNVSVFDKEVPGSMKLTSISASELSNILSESNWSDSLDASDIQQVSDTLNTEKIIATDKDRDDAVKELKSEKQDSFIAKTIDNIKDSQIQMQEDDWQAQLDIALKQQTLKTGPIKQTDFKKTNWGDKKHAWRDDVSMPYHPKKKQTIQNVHVFLDCSGSVLGTMDTFQKMIIYIFELCKKYQYSGLTVYGFGDGPIDKLREMMENSISFNYEEETPDEMLPKLMNHFRENWTSCQRSENFRELFKFIDELQIKEDNPVCVICGDGDWGYFPINKSIRDTDIISKSQFVIFANDRNGGKHGDILDKTVLSVIKSIHEVNKNNVVVIKQV